MSPHTQTTNSHESRDASLREIDSLPGPRGWPIVGNIVQVGTTRPHQVVEQWSHRYGRFFRMKFGPTKILVVADHDAVAAILRDRPAVYRRPTTTYDVSVEMGGTPGVFLAEGEEWRRQRRMVMPGLAPHAVKAYFPQLIRVAGRLQRRWQKAADRRAVIDLSADLKRYTVDIIAGLAFGSDVNTIESGKDVLQQHMDVILPGVARRSLSPFPYWRYVKLPADRRLEQSVAAMSKAVDELIAQARKRMESNPALRTRPSNLLEAMIAAADEEGSGVDDKTIAGNVSTMLLAGEDTTANTLGWMLYLLHRHPEAMRRARDEVRSKVSDPAAFTIEQLDALDYIGACAEEAMRLKPVAPFIPLEAIQDTVVADVRVPAGTIIWCVMRRDSVDEKIFPDAGSFKPERWLGDQPSGDKKVAMPFGAGPRTCPGRYLALLEIKIAMAMLLAGFEIEAVDTPDGNVAQELMGFVMSPAGLTMRLRAR